MYEQCYTDWYIVAATLDKAMRRQCADPASCGWLDHLAARMGWSLAPLAVYWEWWECPANTQQVNDEIIYPQATSASRSWINIAQIEYPGSKKLMHTTSVHCDERCDQLLLSL